MRCGNLFNRKMRFKLTTIQKKESGNISEKVFIRIQRLIRIRKLVHRTSFDDLSNIKEKCFLRSFNRLATDC